MSLPEPSQKRKNLTVSSKLFHELSRHYPRPHDCLVPSRLGFPEVEKHSRFACDCATPRPVGAHWPDFRRELCGGERDRCYGQDSRSVRTGARNGLRVGGVLGLELGVGVSLGFGSSLGLGIAVGVGATNFALDKETPITGIDSGSLFNGLSSSFCSRISEESATDSETFHFKRMVVSSSGDL
ncbi:hypothetical protein Tco_0072693 [Tanacetum coccineum]